eukprot:PRCOL_00005194-RA
MRCAAGVVGVRGGTPPARAGRRARAAAVVRRAARARAAGARRAAAPGGFPAARRERRSLAAPRATASPDAGGGAPAASNDNAGGADVSLQPPPPAAPKVVWRAAGILLMAGQVVRRVVCGKVHWRNTREQVGLVGPRTMGVAMLTASFVGMVFTIQFVREFAKLGLTKTVGGVLALAFCRELSPVITAIILAGRVGSAFAAELGTMQVSEQTDTLRVLNSDPVDYLVTPRVLSCMVCLPILTLLAFIVGLAASTLLADAVYSIPPNVILDSARSALVKFDLVQMTIKASVFGAIVSIISCGCGATTSGGAKGVGESTTTAVVLSLVFIFVSDFVLSFIFLNGTSGDALARVVA